MKDTGKILFNKFLENKNTYNLNVGYWRRKLQNALAQKIELTEQPIQNKNERGKSFYDGNPIFTYYAKDKHKALRIVQVDPKELEQFPNMLILDAWIDRRSLVRFTQDTEVNELVISLVLTEESVERCLYTVRLWFDNKLSLTNLEDYILAANNFSNAFFPEIDRLSPNHGGYQPVRVLQLNLAQTLENTNGGFLKLSQELVAKKLLQPGIKYTSNLDGIGTFIDGHIQTPYVNTDGEIFIHETFLSYVWCIAYSLWTLYDEAVAKPSQNLHAGKQINEIDSEQIRISESVYRHGLSLYVFYSSLIDGKLPNPELYSAEQSFYIGKSNGLYLQAINFILCHEIAHIYLGHTKEDPRNMADSEILIRERAADNAAIDWMLEGVTEENKATIHVGILIGLCSLLFLRSTTKSTTHPNADDRIDNLLTLVQPGDNDPMWGIAALAFRLWDDQFQKFFDWSLNNLGSYKDLYYFVKRQIEDENRGT
jgi:hypothetical protein